MKPRQSCRIRSSITLLSLVSGLALVACAAHRSGPMGPPAPLRVDSGAVGVATGEPTQPTTTPASAAETVPEPLPPPEAEETTTDAIDDREPLAAESEDEASDDPAGLVARALDVCDTARSLWERGEIDEALTTLDRAYALLLQIPDDPEFDQARGDLRHLISRSVVEIYRSRLTTATDPRSPVPVEVNEYVKREIRSFQGAEKSFFLEAYRRSGRYRSMVVRMLHDAGLPEELSWLPLVESGFKTRALSRARALGMWQFISSTGYRYGLNRTRWIDERMDPEKSTRAAIDYLTELHDLFGDWLTALAGYNCGEHRVTSAIAGQRDEYLDRFWDLFELLPRETARYVPRFLATLVILRDPEKYGFELPEPLPPIEFEQVAIGRHVKLADLDRALELDAGTLLVLNPELRRGVTPGEAYELRVPAAVASTFDTKLAALPAYVPPENTVVVHRVRRGETLARIARRYGTTVNAIVRTNKLHSRNRIRIGQRLRIPSRGANVAASRSAGSSRPASITHRVRRGESLWRLASRYGTTVNRIKQDNGLRNDRLYIGQKLRIRTGVPAGARTYAVRRGDTIGKIARAHRVSLKAVLRANGLSRSSTIYPGQILVIP